MFKYPTWWHSAKLKGQSHLLLFPVDGFSGAKLDAANFNMDIVWHSWLKCSATGKPVFFFWMLLRCLPKCSLSVRPVSPIQSAEQQRQEMQYTKLLDRQLLFDGKGATRAMRPYSHLNIPGQRKHCASKVSYSRPMTPAKAQIWIAYSGIQHTNHLALHSV